MKLALTILAASALMACGQDYGFTNFAGLPQSQGGGTGAADGTGTDARFNLPTDAAADSAGNVYVADYQNSTIRRITPAGEATTIAGKAGQTGSANGNGSVARFNNPVSVAVDTNGNVYVSDRGNNTIRKIRPPTPADTNWVVSLLAGTVGAAGTNDGHPGASNTPTV